MFEDYLEDAHKLAIEVKGNSEERLAKRYYRASIFYAVSGIEAFVNYIGDVFEKGKAAQPYEIAFLNDKKFGILEGKFVILEDVRYSSVEEKLKFLLHRFVPDFDFGNNPSWSRFIEFKKFRDSLVHPRQIDDETNVAEYKEIIESGLSSIIEIINCLCLGIFGSPLRKKILELKLRD